MEEKDQEKKSDEKSEKNEKEKRGQFFIATQLLQKQGSEEILKRCLNIYMGQTSMI